jgi:hypothetical protein
LTSTPFSPPSTPSTPPLYAAISPSSPGLPLPLPNHKKLADGSRSIYGINKGKTAGKAAAVGRYTEDIFMGGNSWYVLRVRICLHLEV